MKNKLVIALTPGENHFCHIDHLVDSIVEKLTIDYHICIIAPRDGLSIRRKENVTIKTLSASDKKLFDEIYAKEKRADIGSFVYMQLLVPEYFNEYDKIMFMEVDQHVQHDLKPLWNMVHDKDIKLGAVTVKNSKEVPESFSKVFPNKKYYNTGIVIHDTKTWIKQGYKNLCIQECVKQKEEGGTRFRFYVQGAMNHALSDYLEEIDNEYNFMGLGNTPNIANEDLDNAVILHWNGKQKPWTEDGLYKDRYYKK